MNLMVLIVLFLLVNIFLMVYYFGTLELNDNISDEAVENIVEILKNSNIIIDKELIPKEPYTAYTFEASNDYSSPAKVVAEARDKSHREGKRYFDVSCVKLSSEAFEYVAIQDGDRMEIGNVNDAQKYAKDILKVSGLIDGMQTVCETYEADGIYRVVFYRTQNDLKILDSYIEVETDDRSVRKIYAYNWLKDKISDVKMVSSTDITEILINFAFSEAGKISEPITVERLEYGYYLGSRGGETKTVTASPVWKIITDKKVYYCDVRNGDVLE